MTRLRVAVIGGGANSEHDVSLASAASVSSALDRTRYDVVELTIARDGSWRDASGTDLGLADAITVLQSADVAFPAVHGPRGEDGSLAALLEFAGVPYVGSGTMAGALGMDKWASKLVAESLGIATAGARLVTSADRRARALALPAIVKPVASGSSYGVTRVDDATHLDAALDAALELDSRALIETFITGREIDIAVLERADGSRIVSEPLEIVVDGGLFDTASKYDGSARLLVPAPLTPIERERLAADALAIFDAVGCAGVARVDFFLAGGEFVFNEINTMPGLTAQSQVPRMFAAAAIEYPALLDELIAAATPVVLS